MTHRTLIALALSVVMAMGLSVAACQHKTPEQRADWLAKKIAKELDLDDAQKAKLQEVKAAFLAARGQMESQHEAMFAEVLTQVQGERLDQAKLLQLFQQHQTQVTHLAPAVLAKLSEFHATLTPQQKTKAAEELKEFRDRHRR